MWPRNMNMSMIKGQLNSKQSIMFNPNSVERTFRQVLAALEELKSREEECRAAHELVQIKLLKHKQIQIVFKVRVQ